MRNRKMKANDVEWIVNDLGELGVKVGGNFFFLYKGHSLQYGSHDGNAPTHEYGEGLLKTGEPMRWRPVKKREFGETCRTETEYDPLDNWSVLPAPIMSRKK